MFIILEFISAYFFAIADTKPTKPAIKSSTLPRTSSQGNTCIHLLANDDLRFLLPMSSFIISSKWWLTDYALIPWLKGVRAYCVSFFIRLRCKKHVREMTGRCFPERDRVKPAPPPKPAGLTGQQLMMLPQRTIDINVPADYFIRLRLVQKSCCDLRIEVGSHHSFSLLHNTKESAIVK